MADEVALEDQLLVREQHEVPGAPKVVRELPRGRRAAARCDGAAADGVDQRPRDLRVAGAAAVEREEHRAHSRAGVVDFGAVPEASGHARHHHHLLHVVECHPGGAVDFLDAGDLVVFDARQADPRTRESPRSPPAEARQSTRDS